MDLFEHPELAYPEYTQHIRSVNEIVEDLPLAPQIFRFYEKVTNNYKPGRTFHLPFQKSPVQLSNKLQAIQGINNQSNIIAKTQKQFNDELIKNLGKKQYDLYNQFLAEWYTPEQRNQSKLVQDLKSSLINYFNSNKKIPFVDEVIDNNKDYAFSSAEIQSILDLQSKYLQILFDNDLFYDYESEVFNKDFILCRGLNTNLSNLYLTPHKEKNLLSSYTWQY